MEVNPGFWWGDPRKRYCFEKLGLCGEILLKWIFNKWGGRRWVDWSGSGKEQITCASERGNQHSGFIKRGEYPENIPAKLGLVCFTGRTMLHGVNYLACVGSFLNDVSGECIGPVLMYPAV
jgi:hypothetical protein